MTEGLPLTLRPVQLTMAPASPSMQAMPRPAPRVAQATTAILFFRGFMELLLYLNYKGSSHKRRKERGKWIFRD